MKGGRLEGRIPFLSMSDSVYSIYSICTQPFLNNDVAHSMHSWDRTGCGWYPMIDVKIMAVMHDHPDAQPLLR